MGKWHITKISNQISGKRRTYYLHRLHLCSRSICCRIIQLWKKHQAVQWIYCKKFAYEDSCQNLLRKTVVKMCLGRQLHTMTVFYISSRKNSLPHGFYLKPSSLRFETLKENVHSLFFCDNICYYFSKKPKCKIWFWRYSNSCGVIVETNKKNGQTATVWGPNLSGLQVSCLLSTKNRM